MRIRTALSVPLILIVSACGSPTPPPHVTVDHTNGDLSIDAPLVSKHLTPKDPGDSTDRDSFTFTFSIPPASCSADTCRVSVGVTKAIYDEHSVGDRVRLNCLHGQTPHCTEGSGS